MVISITYDVTTTRCWYQRCRFKNANFLFVGRCYFPGVGWTVQTADSNVVVHSSRNDLNPFEIACENYNVATGGICLQGKTKRYKQCKESPTKIIDANNMKKCVQWIEIVFNVLLTTKLQVSVIIRISSDSKFNFQFLSIIFQEYECLLKKHFYSMYSSKKEIFWFEIELFIIKWLSNTTTLLYSVIEVSKEVSRKIFKPSSSTKN